MSHEPTNERYLRHLRQNRGVWFASSLEMDEWAKEMVAIGLLKPMKDVIPNADTRYWYVENNITTVEQLCGHGYFTPTGLYQLFGVYECLDYQI